MCIGEQKQGAVDKRVALGRAHGSRIVSTTIARGRRRRTRSSSPWQEMNAPGWHRDENGNERIESQRTGITPVSWRFGRGGAMPPLFLDEGGPHPLRWLC